MTYRYREEKGFIASVVIDNNTFTGRQLRALYEREFPDQDTLRAAKRFTGLRSSRILGQTPEEPRIVQAVYAETLTFYPHPSPLPEGERKMNQNTEDCHG